MIFITKYINVEMKIKKIIPVDENNEELAIEKAKEIFINNKTNNEFLDSVKMNYTINSQILRDSELKATIFATMCPEEPTKERLIKYLEKTTEPGLSRDYVLKETLKILDEEYGLSFDKINI